MKHLKTGDLVRLTGYSRASIARMARCYEIPGTFTPDGVHFAFEDSDDLRLWIEDRKKRRSKFAKDRPNFKVASHRTRAMQGGMTFFSQLRTLIELGHSKDAEPLMNSMQRSLDRLREVYESSQQ